MTTPLMITPCLYSLPRFTEAWEKLLFGMNSIDLIGTALERKRLEGKPGAAAPRVLAAGSGWRAVDVVCTSGPSDRVFEERRTFFSVAVVLAGTFTYRSTCEQVALLPGSLLLGNAGECFECAHDHGEGDRCLAFHFEPGFFESIWSEAAVEARRPSFVRHRLPFTPALTRICAAAELLASGHAALDIEELALETAALAVTANGSAEIRSREPCSRQVRRVSEVIRYISGNLDQDLSLAMLASYARMSRFGFLRCFKRITGTTPHSYIRGMRIGEAAVRLCSTDQSVVDIALATGFADLSAFNSAFKAVMSLTPSGYRSGRQFYRLKAEP